MSEDEIRAWAQTIRDRLGEGYSAIHSEYIASAEEAADLSKEYDEAERALDRLVALAIAHALSTSPQVEP